MFDTLPSITHALTWAWADFAPFYTDLESRAVTRDWLRDWDRLARLTTEVGARKRIAYSQATDSAAAREAYFGYLDALQPHVTEAEQRLGRRWLESDLRLPELEVPLRNVQAEVALFRAENLPLLVEEAKLGTRYESVVGAQTTDLEGQTHTIPQLMRYLHQPDRALRERVWRTALARQVADRETLNALWVEIFDVRQRLAAQAQYPDFQAYMWPKLLRFDYTPADAARFRAAIERVVVPAVTRLYAKHRARLGLATLRPWDLTNGISNRPPNPAHLPLLRPLTDPAQMPEKCAPIFHRVDAQLGAYFEVMRKEELLDVVNRPHKAPGAYNQPLIASRRSFVFANGVGLHNDVITLFHEAGHAFHAFESAPLPYHLQWGMGSEFTEVASMSMELLAAEFLAEGRGGFYTERDAARARLELLENILLSWPYIALVDAFQNWAYLNPAAGRDPAQCDAQWRALWARLMPVVDWNGLDAALETGWQRKIHIFTDPFYYIEYGLAQLGAVQVWANFLRDPAEAVRRYRSALSRRGTATVPQLYAEAGARLAFDAETLAEAVQLLETHIAALDAQIF